MTLQTQKFWDLFCLKKLSKFFQFREKRNLQKLMGRMSALKGQGKSNYEIMMMNNSDEIQQLAVCFGERIAVRQCWEKVNLLKESK